ncbi:MAG: secretin N-terminal domain-containing protein [Planctomycetota bacterium]
MMTKRRFLRKGCSRFFALAVTLLLVNNCLFAAEQAGASEGTGYEIFPLKHITVEQGKTYLAKVVTKHITVEQGKTYLAKVVTGTVTHFPGSSALLVTAEPRKLAKAKAILDLVDGSEQYVVKAVLPISAVRNIPSNEQIGAKLSDIAIGDFSHPPGTNMATRAIIDIHNDAVVVIAPVSALEKIVSAIGQLSNSGKPAAKSKPGTQGKLEAPARLKISKSADPNELRSHVGANGKIETQLNNLAAALKQRTREQKTPEQKAPEQKVPEQKAPVPVATIRPYAPESIANGEDVVNLALTDFEKLTIIQFLGLVGPYLQLDFMYDPKLLVGEVTLNPHGKFRGPIKVKDLYPLLESVLKFKSLAMTRGKGNLVTIVPVAEALNIDPALLEIDKVKIERGDGIVTRIFKLEHIDTASAQNLLTGMSLTTSITPITETKTLIVTGYAYRMSRIQALLNLVDKPGEPRKFRFRQLQYTMAQTLAPKLQTLAEQLGTISITVGGTSAAAATPPRVSQKRPNETTAQYQARLRQEALAKSRAQSRTPARPPVGLAEPTKPTVYLDADERTNRILMIGLDEQLDDVEELINTLDVAQQDLRTLELYKIEHVDAEEVRKKLEELQIIGVSQPTSYSSRITGGTTPPTAKPGTTRPPTSRTSRTQTARETTEAPTEEPQVVVVEPTNSLLVNATAEQHTKIAEILSYVDSEMEADKIPYQLYPLENQSPEHLSEILEKLIQETVQDKEGKVEKVVRKQDEQITIVPDPNTFSLIVYASKKNQEWIANLIEQLDKRRPQVLIDVTLVEVSKTDNFEYDLNLIESLPDLVDTSGLIPPIMGDPNSTGSPIGRLLSSKRHRYVDFGVDGGSGTGFYADKHINALLTAMHTKNYGRVLAKPKILVNDNEKGTIQTTETTYVEKTGSTVVEGALGTVQTSVDFTAYDAGITLDIVPHISKGDLLRLDIMLSRSDFLPTTGEKPPNTTASDITTTVTVPDGSTIILGGMLKLNQTKGGTKVPLLGDIPLLGGLFRSVGNSDIQKKLYVFVKAEVLRPEETLAGLPDLERISDRNKVAFEEFERKFQSHQGWPGMEPTPVEPVRVLEAQ